jgi:hypothetical protein
MLMRYTPIKMHAHEMHAHEMHAHEMHAHDMHAHKMHAHEMYESGNFLIYRTPGQGGVGPTVRMGRRTPVPTEAPTIPLANKNRPVA